MDHGVCDFDSRGECVEDEAAGFLLEDLDEFSIGGEIVFVAEDGGGEMAGEGVRGAQVVVRAGAVYEERVRAKDFVGEMWFTDELIEWNAEELRGGMERSGAVLAFREKVSFSGDGSVPGAIFGCAIVFACDAAGEQRKGP